MSRILITGSTGFIGSRLAQMARAANHEVTCLVRRTSQADRLRSLDVRLSYGDISDRGSLAAAIAGQDIVFHLAGCLRATRVEEFYRINAEGARNVAWACGQQATPPVLVHVSSLAATGPSSRTRSRNESDPPQPVSSYGRSKLAGEDAVRSWADRVPVTIVRPPIVFGEADPASREIFAPIARLGIHVVPSRQTHFVSLIHVEDLAHLLILAAERGQRLQPSTGSGFDRAQGCYFAASEHDPTYAELGQMIGHALGRRRTWIVRTGPLVVWSTACLGTALSCISGRPWYFNMDKAREARAGSWTCSANAAHQALGFTVAAPLAERLRQTAQWYLQNGWL